MGVERSTWIAYVVTTVVLGSIVGAIAYAAQTSFLSEFISLPAIPLGCALLIFTLTKPIQIVIFKRAKAFLFYFFVYLWSAFLALIGFTILMMSKVAHINPPVGFLNVVGSLDPLSYVVVVGTLLPAVLFIWLFERATLSIMNMLSSGNKT